MKSSFDGAELAGNSVAADVLLRLATLLDRADWRTHAERSFAHHARRLAAAPWSMPFMVEVMERSLRALRHVVIVGEPEHEDTRALLAVYESRLHADDALVLVHSGNRAALAALVPFAAALPMQNARATAYVCVSYACRQPVHEPGALAALLDEPVPGEKP